MRRKPHVRFLGGGDAAMLPRYPTIRFREAWTARVADAVVVVGRANANEETGRAGRDRSLRRGEWGGCTTVAVIATPAGAMPVSPYGTRESTTAAPIQDNLRFVSRSLAE